jgi:threonine aldolase
VSVCLSKGLGAPVGSILVGSRDLIEAAHRWRKMLGGGLRQAGVLAAAGLHAIDHHVDRLADDHANADVLANGLRTIDALKVRGPFTNMVFVDLRESDVAPLAAHLRGAGIVASAYAQTRFVTHLDVDRAQIERVVARVKDFYAAR